MEIKIMRQPAIMRSLRMRKNLSVRALNKARRPDHSRTMHITMLMTNAVRIAE